MENHRQLLENSRKLLENRFGLAIEKTERMRRELKFTGRLANKTQALQALRRIDEHADYRVETGHNLNDLIGLEEARNKAKNFAAKVRDIVFTLGKQTVPERDPKKNPKEWVFLIKELMPPNPKNDNLREYERVAELHAKEDGTITAYVTPTSLRRLASKLGERLE